MVMKQGNQSGCLVAMKQETKVSVAMKQGPKVFIARVGSEWVTCVYETGHQRFHSHSVTKFLVLVFNLS